MAAALERNKGLVSLKLFVKRLRDCLHNGDLRRVVESSEEKESVPDDVREGQFAILLADDDEAKNEPTRFVVELCVLKHPAFLKLLKRAEEEYGFRQKGPLTIPCQPEDVRRIIQDMPWKSL